jgi:hypothetical protein
VFQGWLGSAIPCAQDQEYLGNTVRVARFSPTM